MSGIENSSEVNRDDTHHLGLTSRRIRKTSDVIDSLPVGDAGSPISPRTSCYDPSVHVHESTNLEQLMSSISCLKTVSSTAPCATKENRNGRDIIEHPLSSQAPETRIRHGDETDARSTESIVQQSVEPPSTPTINEARMPVDPLSATYNMNHERRGMAVIISNDIFDFEPRRAGSDADVIALREVFKLLQFEVYVHNNLTRTQISDELNKLATIDHNDSDCFILTVLTHGEAPELLHAKDGVYRKSELWSPFISSNCPTLAGKPKIFFVQACRGDRLEKGTKLVNCRGGYTSQTDSSPRWSYVIPVWADFLMAHSTHEGFYSWRNPKDGTWYIQMLCETLTKYHQTTDLLKMLTIVNRRVALEYESFVENRPDLSGCKEIPSFTSTLMRDVYFERDDCKLMNK